jgi:hypothetical protein
MPAFGAGLEQQLQAVGQGIAFDLEAIQGKGGQEPSNRQANNRQRITGFPATHRRSISSLPAKTALELNQCY